MKRSTLHIHEKLKTVGEEIGFITSAEVSPPSLAYIPIEKRYIPRVDVVWSLEISDSQRKTLAKVTGRLPSDFRTLPIVAIEVEGTDPSTKTLESDVANIAALGSPFGLLAVYNDKSPDKDSYRRASKVLRSLRTMYGKSYVFPVEALWLEELHESVVKEREEEHKQSQKKSKLGTGGEGAWSKKIRQAMKKMGLDAGFVVEEEWTPPNIKRAYTRLSEQSISHPQVTWLPAPFDRRDMRNYTDFLTASKIDLVWMIRMPEGFITLLDHLFSLDPDLAEYSDFDPRDWRYLPVAGFEIENSVGKHAGGGLINLSAHTIMGVCVVPDEKNARKMEEKLISYRPILGLKNIYVEVCP